MVGIDLVFIPEFRERLDAGGNSLLEKAFNIRELKNRQPDHLAGLWAAKEAVMKAADHMPARMTDIRITHGSDGKPVARVSTDTYAISIAHHGEYAVAVALKVGV